MNVAPLRKHVAVQVEGNFAGKKPNKPAKDLSGVACMPPLADGSRLCLFVNDETRHAQFAVVKDKTLVPGDLIPLVADALSNDIPGAMPQTDCPGGSDEVSEFDGEAVAYAAPYFYIAASHGCGRRTGRFNLASFLLARVRVDQEGRPADKAGKALPQKRWSEAVELTYRLSDVLRRAEPVGAYFGKSLDETPNGLNIEGLAIDGERLLIGLRAPSIRGAAFIVGTDIASLFAPGHEPEGSKPEVIKLKLGQKMGIRDLARLPDGRFLVLAGPAQDQDLAYRIVIADPGADWAVTELCTLDPVTDDKGRPVKAEGLAVLSADERELRLLVLFDGLDNGGPIELTVKLP